MVRSLTSTLNMHVILKYITKTEIPDFEVLKAFYYNAPINNLK